MMKVIHFVQNLSLDIAAGAVITSLFIARVFEVKLSLNILLGLAIAIWLIYTLDHLIDAQKTKGKATNPRHAFHQKNSLTLKVLALLFFTLGCVNLFFLPAKTIYIGLFLIFFSVLYFLYLQKAKQARIKALFAAFVYVAGVSVGPFSQVEGLSFFQFFVVAQILLLAYANLLVIPLYELAIDQEDQKFSIVSYKGEKTVNKTVFLLCVVVLLLSFLISFLQPNQLLNQAILVMMTAVLLVLLRFKDYFRAWQLYRILADGIFFLPLITLL